MRNSFMRLMLCTAAGIAAAAPTFVRAALPEPAVAPTSWELNFRFHDPQRVSVVVPGQARPMVYWYMIYAVENPTDQEVDFYPTFDLVTDTMKVTHSELYTSPEAFDAIRRRTRDPLLLPPEKMLGRLLRGKDQARHGVAIWRDFDPQAKAFTVYIGGLSGEVTRLPNPAYDPTQPESETNKRQFLLRKTLAIPYKFPASASQHEKGVPERQTEAQKWIMR